MGLQPTIVSFRLDGFVRIPEILSGEQLRQAQEAFAAATAGAAQPGEVPLLEHVGEFLDVLGKPPSQAAVACLCLLMLARSF